FRIKPQREMFDEMSAFFDQYFFDQSRMVGEIDANVTEAKRGHVTMVVGTPGHEAEAILGKGSEMSSDPAPPSRSRRQLREHDGTPFDYVHQRFVRGPKTSAIPYCDNKLLFAKGELDSKAPRTWFRTELSTN